MKLVPMAMHKLKFHHHKPEPKSGSNEPECYSPLAVSYAVMDTYYEIMERFPILRPWPVTWDPDSKVVEIKNYSSKDHLGWLLINLINNAGLFVCPFWFIAINRILTSVSRGLWKFDDGVPFAIAVYHFTFGLTCIMSFPIIIPIVWKRQDFRELQRILVSLAKHFMTGL